MCRLKHILNDHFFIITIRNTCDAKYINTYNIPGAVMLNWGGAKIPTEEKKWRRAERGKNFFKCDIEIVKIWV